MKAQRLCLAPVMSGAIALAIALPALAQVNMRSTITAPDYGSDPVSAGLSNSNFNSPESDGRPGVKFYKQGMAAYHRGDVEHALYMLKLSAYWAYAPAAYNLGVIYFQGEGGVPVNRPMGTAWMFIAAERGAQDYVDARHMMVSSLGYDERTKASELLQGLQEKYGEKMSMRRAKAQWAYAKASKTGSRVGGAVGELRVGIPSAGGGFHTPMGGAANAGTVRHSWMKVLGGGSVDGAVAYGQFGQSSNPYDQGFLKNRTGTVTVEPLQKGNPDTSNGKSTQSASSAQPSPKQ